MEGQIDQSRMWPLAETHNRQAVCSPSVTVPVRDLADVHGLDAGDVGVRRALTRPVGRSGRVRPAPSRRQSAAAITAAESGEDQQRGEGRREPEAGARHGWLQGAGPCGRPAMVRAPRPARHSAVPPSRRSVVRLRSDGPRAAGRVPRPGGAGTLAEGSPDFEGASRGGANVAPCCAAGRVESALYVPARTRSTIHRATIGAARTSRSRFATCVT